MSYDSLILSPGISFKKTQIDGYSIEDKILSHTVGQVTKKILDFKDRLDSLENSCTLVISSPDYPYRCPPAPYERASMIAYYLKKKQMDFKNFYFRF